MKKRRPLLESLFWGAFWGALIAASFAPLVFGSMSNPEGSDFTPIPQGWGASLNAMPAGLLFGLAAGFVWWLTFHAFRGRGSE